MSGAEQENQAIDLRHLAARVAIGIVKRKGLLALGLLASAALALLAAPHVPRSYQSEATLQLRRARAPRSERVVGSLAGDRHIVRM